MSNKHHPKKQEDKTPPVITQAPPPPKPKEFYKVVFFGETMRCKMKEFVIEAESVNEAIENSLFRMDREQGYKSKHIADARIVGIYKGNKSDRGFVPVTDDDFELIPQLVLLDRNFVHYDSPLMASAKKLMDTSKE